MLLRLRQVPLLVGEAPAPIIDLWSEVVAGLLLRQLLLLLDLPLEVDLLSVVQKSLRGRLGDLIAIAVAIGVRGVLLTRGHVLIHHAKRLLKQVLGLLNLHLLVVAHQSWGVRAIQVDGLSILDYHLLDRDGRPFLFLGGLVVELVRQPKIQVLLIILSVRASHQDVFNLL